MGHGGGKISNITHRVLFFTLTNTLLCITKFCIIETKSVNMQVRKSRGNVAEYMRQAAFVIILEGKNGK